MPNYVFYDFETCSSNVSYGQIIEAAAVLVNDSFQELDRFEARCRLSPGIIPEAMALIVNGFFEPFTRELPMEYAVELNKLMALEMEGSIG